MLRIEGPLLTKLRTVSQQVYYEIRGMIGGVSYCRAALGCHKPVVKALLGRDPEMATRAIWKHIDSVLERIMELEGTDEAPRRGKIAFDSG
ncbi:MAG: hypothetical protein EXQ58_10695 [Acidobacteria bacterium]|nr:hypothetical protein [Acidobacteriota bacterium]